MSEEYIDQSSDPMCVRSSKENRVLVSSDGLYEYRPPVGLNVKLVKNETGNKIVRTASKKRASTSTEQTIYLKSEPIDDDDDDAVDAFEENESVDTMYYLESNFEDSIDEKTSDSMRKSGDPGSSDAASENDSKIMQIKPVRTNKVRLGHTSANKGKISVHHTSTATKIKPIINDTSKENTSTGRTVKAKTNAKGEPKQPKKCEICGNTYMYQHALQRYLQFSYRFRFRISISDFDLDRTG